MPEANDAPQPPRVPMTLGAYWTVTVSLKPQTKGTADSSIPAPASVFHLAEVPKTCGACGRTDTLCIHHDSQESLAGKWEEMECYCPACGWFTLYAFAD